MNQGLERREEREADAHEGFGVSGFLFSSGIAVLYFGLLSGVVKLWDSTGAELFPAFRYVALVGVPLLLLGAASVSKWASGMRIDPLPFVFLLVVVFFTDWLCRDFSLLQGPSIRGVILLCGVVSFALLWQRSTIFLGAAPLVIPLIYLCVFFSTAEGRLLYSDDHPSMLHRLQMLKEHFPFIPFYNPTWNAGFDNRDFFATGVLNVFLLFSPLIFVVRLVENYNLLIGLLVFFFVPLAAYVAARIEELESPVPSICALLAMTSSLLWYQWSLKYGAIGFITAVSLIPLNVALFAKILSPSREFSRREAVLTVVSLTLMSLWSLTVVIFMPLALVALVRLRAVLRKRYMKAVLAALLVLNVPWVAVFYTVSSVGSFIALSKAPSSARPERIGGVENGQGQSQGISRKMVRGGVRKASVGGAMRAVREVSVKTNPVIVFLAIPGLFLLRRRSTKFSFLLMSGWLVLLGTVGAALKPQLELERMLVVLGLLCAIPAAHVLRWALLQQRHISTALISGYMFAGVFAVSGVIANRSPEQIVFADDLVWELSAAIKQHGGSGRTVFSGFMLHDLGGGHIAPLTLFTGKPLVASTPFHSVWWYTDVIPPAFLGKGEAGYEEFFELQNATAVVARQREWRTYFDSHPETYSVVFRRSGYSLYKRVTEGSYFLSGDGEIISQGSDSVVVKVASPAAVIKFNYLPFLKLEPVDGGKELSCKLSPEVVGGGMRFIRLENCAPNEKVLIRAKGALARLYTQSGLSGDR